MITTETPCAAPASVVHDLLVDTSAWELWAPHVASVRSDTLKVHDGWTGDVRANFSPTATTMTVDEVCPDGGYSWHSTMGPWRLDYDNHVQPDGTGCRLVWRARLSGPLAGLLERLVAPLSSFGQRRRTSRLARLAERLAPQG